MRTMPTSLAGMRHIITDDVLPSPTPRPVGGRRMDPAFPSEVLATPPARRRRRIDVMVAHL